MSNDPFDKQAEELLPCSRDYWICTDEQSAGHRRDCPAYYRPAVAEALRDAYGTGRYEEAKRASAYLCKLAWSEKDIAAFLNWTGATQ